MHKASVASSALEIGSKERARRDMDDATRNRVRAAHVASMHASVMSDVIAGLRAELNLNGDDVSVLDNPSDPKKPGLKQVSAAHSVAPTPPV